MLLKDLCIVGFLNCLFVVIYVCMLIVGIVNCLRMEWLIGFCWKMLIFGLLLVLIMICVINLVVLNEVCVVVYWFLR